MTLATAPIDFSLPEENIAREPVESAHGAGRADVRMMVAKGSASIAHADFADLGRYLMPGDVIVVNTSRTLPAALRGVSPNGEEVLVHVASPAHAGLWLIELRRVGRDGGSIPLPDEPPFRTLSLPGGAIAHLLTRDARSHRLWIAVIEGVRSMAGYLERHGRPIRYEPGPTLPIASYQTVFANQPGSAEMPSAGRPFTDAMVTSLISAGVVIVPIVLHAGVSSFEVGETPGEERFDVPEHTATIINEMRSSGRRVVAVGTTVVRALETVSDSSGQVHPGSGITDLVITPRRGVASVDGLMTGWHEPRSSHLSLLEAFLDRHLLARIYDKAIAAGYRWHEFGDVLLILP